ncbi:MAG: 23S rRNA (guanosine(2251)-2'-O)-methyltransferase RlmB [Synergistetes bacterium]|nr:23S rRNA (guanosine(2251)-2'-O)-methyltransferase RlmB [Synergistota bacterium]
MNIYGRIPIIEALKGNANIKKVMISNSAKGKQVSKIIHLAKEQGIPIQIVPPKSLNKYTSSLKHQGVVAISADYTYFSIPELLKESPQIILLLDRVADPMNLGAIIRTAEAMGINSIILPARGSAPITSTVVKASAGAISHIKIAQTQKIIKEVKNLKESGFNIIGIETSGESTFDEIDYFHPLLLVVGSEGKGIRSSLLELCNSTVKIPMYGKVNSLNVSVATGIALYEVVRHYKIATEKHNTSP